MIEQLTVAGNAVSAVVMPPKPGFRMVEFTQEDTVGMNQNPYTRQVQAQEWVGGDMWGGTMTLPQLTQAQADEWLAFLSQCRGIRNPFRLGNPLKIAPGGNGSLGIPLVDNSVAGNNLANAQILYTRGWTPGHAGVLLPGDHIQIGYRLHKVLDRVMVDANGKAAIAIWPALREAPVDSTLGVVQPVKLNHPQGLFRRADNKIKSSTDYTRMTSLSFAVMEWK